MSQQINLFNPIFKQQKKYLSAVTMAQALGLILLGSLLMAGYAAYRSRSIAGEAQVLATQISEAQALQSRVEAQYPAKRRNKALEKEIQQTEADLQSLQSVARVLQEGDLGNTTGYARYFGGFARQIIDGVWLTGLNIQGAGAEIEIRGRAVSPELVPAYIGRLKSEQVLQGKSFSRLDMQVPPQQGENGRSDAAAQTPVAANYIEFSLQTTGISGQASAAGVNNK